MFDKPHRARQALRLGIVRFRSLLDAGHRLRDLVRDGKEKSRGGYILDRQYVLSLIDDTLDGLGKLVFDAHVLCPEGSDELYAAYDECRQTARRLSSPDAHREGRSRDDDWNESPECRLLLDVVDWMDGSSACAGPHPRGLLGAVLDRALRGLEPLVRAAPADRILVLSTPAVNHRLGLVDLDGLEQWPEGEGAERTLRAARNHPLRLILAGAAQEESDGECPDGTMTRRWLAVVTDDRLSLFGPSDGPRIVVEALVSGQRTEDYLFVCSDGSGEVPNLPLPGLGSERMEAGQVAWSCDLPGRDLEQTLIGLGAALLGRADGGRSRHAPVRLRESP